MANTDTDDAVFHDGILSDFVILIRKGLNGVYQANNEP